MGKRILILFIIFLLPFIGIAQVVPAPAPPPPPPGLPVDGFMVALFLIAIIYGSVKIFKDSSS
ncbi:MAG: hypothetical protein ABJH82_13930 [Polaribacter sp.]|uniref:hypothetical protein n=1 Tax=Polaribacter sp. TaxID=1920175 RepID=UPI0032675827